MRQFISEKKERPLVLLFKVFRLLFAEERFTDLSLLTQPTRIFKTEHLSEMRILCLSSRTVWRDAFRLHKSSLFLFRRHFSIKRCAGTIDKSWHFENSTAGRIDETIVSRCRDNALWHYIAYVPELNEGTNIRTVGLAFVLSTDLMRRVAPIIIMGTFNSSNCISSVDKQLKPRADSSIAPKRNRAAESSSIARSVKRRGPQAFWQRDQLAFERRTGVSPRKLHRGCKAIDCNRLLPCLLVERRFHRVVNLPFSRHPSWI